MYEHLAVSDKFTLNTEKIKQYFEEAKKYVIDFYEIQDIKISNFQLLNFDGNSEYDFFLLITFTKDYPQKEDQSFLTFVEFIKNNKPTSKCKVIFKNNQPLKIIEIKR